MASNTSPLCVGGTAEITSSMMEESEEGASQLASLKYTQAEANAIEEKFTTMLQVKFETLLSPSSRKPYGMLK